MPISPASLVTTPQPCMSLHWHDCGVWAAGDLFSSALPYKVIPRLGPRRAAICWIRELGKWSYNYAVCLSY